MDVKPCFQKNIWIHSGTTDELQNFFQLFQGLRGSIHPQQNPSWHFVRMNLLDWTNGHLKSSWSQGCLGFFLQIPDISARYLTNIFTAKTVFNTKPRQATSGDPILGGPAFPLRSSCCHQQRCFTCYVYKYIYTSTIWGKSSPCFFLRNQVLANNFL